MLENLQIAQAFDGMIFLHETSKNPPILHPHQHAELECNLVVRGEITYVVGSKRYTFKKGSLLWLFPDQVHQLVDRSADAQCFVVVFTPNLIKRSCRGERYAALRKGSPVAPDAVLSTEMDEPTFNRLCETMHSLLPGEVDSQTLNRELGFGLSDGFSYSHEDPDWLNAGLRQLLLSCWRQHVSIDSVVGEVSIHPAVKKALELLQHSGGEIQSAELADKCGLSSPHLSRIFHREIGIPIRRYRSTVKLARFWECFSGAVNRTLLEAAFEAGFGSYAQFYRVFRDAHGSSPRDLIQKPE